MVVKLNFGSFLSLSFNTFALSKGQRKKSLRLCVMSIYGNNQ